MLEFVSDLFVNMAPNERAWVAALTKYLKAHGHEFATGDSLCQQFANALVPYQVLVQLVKAEMTKIINFSCGSLNSTASMAPVLPLLDEKTPVPAQVYANAHNSTGPTKADGAPECPSPYL